MAAIRRLVLDVLKPHEPSVTELADTAAEVDGVAGVNATLIEVDEEVENVKLTVAGDDIDEDGVYTAVDELGGSVHSVDEVVCGENVVEASTTPQD